MRAVSRSTFLRRCVGLSPPRSFAPEASPDVFLPPAHRSRYRGFFATYHHIRLQDLRSSLLLELDDQCYGLDELADEDCFLMPASSEIAHCQHLRAYEGAILDAARMVMLAAGAAEAVILQRRLSRGEPPGDARQSQAGGIQRC